MWHAEWFTMKKISKIDGDGISIDDTFYVPARPDVSACVSTVGSFGLFICLKIFLRIWIQKFRSHMATNDQIICLRHFWVWWIMKIWFSTVLIVWECQYPHWGFFLTLPDVNYWPLVSHVIIFLNSNLRFLIITLTVAMLEDFNGIESRCYDM